MTNQENRARSLEGPSRVRRQRLLVLGLLAMVIAVDQAMKWWAWRHFPSARINAGGDVLTGSTVGSWFADPVQGALLDLLDVGSLSLAALLLLRRRHAPGVLVAGSLMIGGWTSNLLDRVVTHYVTAPGSVRGVVDFISIKPHYYNIADLVIVGATPLFLVAIGAQHLRARVTQRPATAPLKSTATRRRPARTAVLVAIGLVVAVGTGAANYGGTTAPIAAHASAR